MHILDYDTVESGGKLRVEGSMHILDYDKVRLRAGTLERGALLEPTHDRAYG
jgi:hypothetical protein